MSEHNSDPARKTLTPSGEASPGARTRPDGWPGEIQNLTPLNEAAKRQMAKHVCKIYSVRDGRTVCTYCGKEIEL